DRARRVARRNGPVGRRRRRSGGGSRRADRPAPRRARARTRRRAVERVAAALPVLTTERLVLRELTPEDAGPLHDVLGDPETMRFYPHPYGPDEVAAWIEWSRRSYERNGFGLWALVLKETGELVGDCGLTVQDVD